VPDPDLLTITHTDRDALHRAAAVIGRIVAAYDAATTPIVAPLTGTATLTGDLATQLVPATKPAHSKGKPYTPAQRERALAKIRKHTRRKHKHPIAATATETGIPHKTLIRFARDAGLVK